MMRWSEVTSLQGIPSHERTRERTQPEEGRLARRDDARHWANYETAPVVNAARLEMP